MGGLRTFQKAVFFRSRGALDNSTSMISGLALQGFYAAQIGRLRLKFDGTRVYTRFRLSAKRTSPFKSAGASVQSTTGSRGVRISGCNAGYTMFRGSVKSTGYPLHSPVSPTFLLLCITVCHHISTGLYHTIQNLRLLHMIQHLSNDLS